jgi:hypothetical protein
MDVERLAAARAAAGSRVWYRILLSSDQVVGGHAIAIKRVFRESISGLIDQTGMWLVAASREGAATSEELFVSPAAVSIMPHLIAQYAARPSAPPERARSTLLVGDEAAWDHLPYSTH